MRVILGNSEITARVGSPRGMMFRDFSDFQAMVFFSGGLIWTPFCKPLRVAAVKDSTVIQTFIAKPWRIYSVRRDCDFFLEIPHYCKASVGDKIHMTE